MNRNMRSYCENTWFCRRSPFVSPQAPSDILGLAKQILPGKKTHWEQETSLITQTQREQQVEHQKSRLSLLLMCYYLIGVPPHEDMIKFYFIMGGGKTRDGKPVEYIFIRISHQVGFDTRSFFKVGIRRGGSHAWSQRPGARASLLVFDSLSVTWIYAV